MKSGTIPFLIIVVFIAAAIMFLLSGCATRNCIEIECDAPTKETEQTVKVGDQSLKVGAIRKLKYGSKNGANEFSDNKSFTLSFLNAIGK